MSFVARVWTFESNIKAVVASADRITTEWVECGADKWHDIVVAGDVMSASAIMAAITYDDDVLTLEGRSITVVSTNDIT